jgi:hypothetical protein
MPPVIACARVVRGAAVQGSSGLTSSSASDEPSGPRVCQVQWVLREMTLSLERSGQRKAPPQGAFQNTEELLPTGRGWRARIRPQNGDVCDPKACRKVRKPKVLCTSEGLRSPLKLPPTRSLSHCPHPTGRGCPYFQVNKTRDEVLPRRSAARIWR